MFSGTSIYLLWRCHARGLCQNSTPKKKKKIETSVQLVKCVLRMAALLIVNRRRVFFDQLVCSLALSRLVLYASSSSSKLWALIRWESEFC